VVLHPLIRSPVRATGGCSSAWPTIERTQKQIAQDYLLVTQPDHAALAGALAARFVAPKFPSIDAQIARAIEVHDSGWAIFKPEADPHVTPSFDKSGKPISFLEVDPSDFLRAWTESIHQAEAVCAAGGYIVSSHFCALAEWRLSAASDTAENTQRLKAFLQVEIARRERLQRLAGRSREELRELLLVLQFCDLLSLYLCCGATEAVEFPQQFEAGNVRVVRDNQAFVLEPSPFGGAAEGASVGVRAQRFSAGKNQASTELGFVLM
jgi:Protein of unknown function (DUF3891)